MQKLLKALGFVVLGLLSLLLFLQMTFPYARVKDRLVDGLSNKYEVSVGAVRRGWLPGKMIMEKVTLRSRLVKADDVQTTMFFPRLEIDVGVLGLVRGVAGVDVDVEMPGGKHLVLTVEVSKSQFSVHIQGGKVPAQGLPTREYAMMPISGALDINADLTAPLEKNRVDWSKLVGRVSLACLNGCTVGDGSRVKFPTLNQRSEAMMGKGVEFGPVNVDRFAAQMDFAKGVAKISKWDFQSKDGTAKLDIEIKLDKVFGNSVIEGCVRYDASDELRKRVPSTHSQIMVIGGMKGPDGLFQVHLSDRVGHMRKLSQLCPDLGSVPATNQRPNLTVMPDSDAVFTKKEPLDPPMVPSTAPPVAPPPATPPTPDAAPAGTVPSAAPGAPVGAAPESVKTQIVAPGNGTAGAAGVGEAADKPVEKAAEPVIQ
ncbi:MAG: type II secretion system protein GspN [Kofleriaceae bacterium]|nr:type II secretion system protein GspN [Kofleriaceae bacterium]